MSLNRAWSLLSFIISYISISIFSQLQELELGLVAEEQDNEVHGLEYDSFDSKDGGSRTLRKGGGFHTHEDSIRLALNDQKMEKERQHEHQYRTTETSTIQRMIRGMAGKRRFRRLSQAALAVRDAQGAMVVKKELLSLVDTKSAFAHHNEEDDVRGSEAAGRKFVKYRRSTIFASAPELEHRNDIQDSLIASHRAIRKLRMPKRERGEFYLFFMLLYD